MLFRSRRWLWDSRWRPGERVCVAPALPRWAVASLARGGLLPRALHRSPFPSGLGNPGGLVTRTAAWGFQRTAAAVARVPSGTRRRPFVALDRSAFPATAPVAGGASISRQTLVPVVNGGWCARVLAGFVGQTFLVQGGSLGKDNTAR